MSAKEKQKKHHAPEGGGCFPNPARSSATSAELAVVNLSFLSEYISPSIYLSSFHSL